MNKLLILIILICTCFQMEAQEYKLITKIDAKAISIEVDKFDYIYIVETNKISKYSKEGQILFTYQNFENGDISTFDVSDPLKPIVYFKNFNTLTILDNKLSELNSINLFDKNINQIECICSSNNMEYWIFDNIDSKLKKLDKQFNLVNESESFFNLFDSIHFPKKLNISNNKLYSLDNSGISSFDLYGAYIKTLSIKNVESFQIIDENIVFLEQDKLVSYNEKTLQIKTMTLPKTNELIQDAKLLKDNIIVKTKQYVYFYSTL